MRWTHRSPCHAILLTLSNKLFGELSAPTVFSRSNSDPRYAVWAFLWGHVGAGEDLMRMPSDDRCNKTQNGKVSAISIVVWVLLHAFGQRHGQWYADSEAPKRTTVSVGSSFCQRNPTAHRSDKWVWPLPYQKGVMLLAQGWVFWVADHGIYADFQYTTSVSDTRTIQSHLNNFLCCSGGYHPLFWGITKIFLGNPPGQWNNVARAFAQFCDD